jgi:hypothetical protein
VSARSSAPPSARAHSAKMSRHIIFAGAYTVVAFILAALAAYLIQQGRAGIYYMVQFPTMSDGSIATLELITGGAAGTLAVLSILKSIRAITRRK